MTFGKEQQRMIFWQVRLSLCVQFLVLRGYLKMALGTVEFLAGSGTVRDAQIGDRPAGCAPMCRART